MEDIIMTKWKDALSREAPKTMMHTNLAMNSNNTNVQDAKDHYESLNCHIHHHYVQAYVVP